MKILIIGGTGTISTAISRRLADSGHDLYLINRGNASNRLQSNVKFIQADINDEKAVSESIGGMEFDAVCDFIGFVQPHLEHDFRLFGGRTKQFVYISSASAYNKLPSDYVITEGTSLANPFWEYSRNKIQCEEYLMKMYREQGFPVTIVRPSHTYCKTSVPLGVELKAYHVSSEFLAAVSDYNLTGSLIGDKANSAVFDNSKLKRAVPDFRSKIRFDEGIRNTLNHVL